eukprot:TRINITY_DN1435_c0_g1_i1.p1 TRINITY_DN1435_c0_g1~~TRINITY_DN1435_c0_g1_i1.p1  ORF type:complete len:705 (-),score=179.34 TRINITY_DN1435_c0_g1_i1:62-2176(-)
MSLPWDDWFYHLSSKADEVNTAYNNYMKLRDQIETTGTQFNSDVEKYQTLIIYGTGLLLFNGTAAIADSDYPAFLTQTEANKPSTYDKGTDVVKVFQWMNTIVGGTFLADGVHSFGSLVVWPAMKSGFSEISGLVGNLVERAVETGVEATVDEALSDVSDLSFHTAEEGTVAGIETAGEELSDEAVASASSWLTADSVGLVSTTLAKLGFGTLSHLAVAGTVFLCVGIDAALGAIEGAKEAAQLDAALDQINTVLAKVQAYMDTLTQKRADLDAAILKAEQAFIAAMVALGAIQECNDQSWKKLVPGTDSLDTFNQAAYNGSRFYVVLAKIRDDWYRMLTNKPDLDWATFKLIEELQRDSTIMTADQVDKYLDYCATYSDTLKAAKAKATLADVMFPLSRLTPSSQFGFRYEYESEIRGIRQTNDHQLKFLKSQRSSYSSTQNRLLKITAHNCALLGVCFSVFASDRQIDKVMMKLICDDVDGFEGKRFLPAQVAKNITKSAGGYIAVKLIYLMSNSFDFDLLSTYSSEKIFSQGPEVFSSLDAAFQEVPDVNPVNFTAILRSKDSRSIREALRLSRVSLNTQTSALEFIHRGIEKCNAAILAQQQYFLDIMACLSKFQAPSFRWYLPVSHSNSGLFTSAMASAVHQFCPLLLVRFDWQTFQKTLGASRAKWEFFVKVELQKKPVGVSAEQFQTVIEVVKKIVA